MNRRAFLAGISGVVPITTGCLQQVSEPGQPPADHNREFEVSDIQKPNGDIITDISVNVSSGTTANHPTILKIIFSNIDDVEHTFETGFPAPIRPQIAVSDDGSILILVSKNETDMTDIIPQSPIDGCWEAKRSDFEVWDKRGGTRLPPGENIEREYVLLADPESESCFSPGEYEFSGTYWIDPATDGSKRNWDFTIRVK